MWLVLSSPKPVMVLTPISVLAAEGGVSEHSAIHPFAAKSVALVLLTISALRVVAAVVVRMWEVGDDPNSTIAELNKNVSPLVIRGFEITPSALYVLPVAPCAVPTRKSLSPVTLAVIPILYIPFGNGITNVL